jgi:recombinational DNA repair protein (RecF pathway)
MGIIKANCDLCGEPIEERIFYDYDDRLLCEKCYYTVELKREEEIYREKKEWLKSTFIKQQLERGKRIRRLKDTLKIIKEERR